MAVTFPTSPSNGQTFTANGLSYVYNATYGVWRLNVSAGGGGGGVTTYATAAELPLTGNSDGDMAFVQETDRLYLSNDNGWFNIALINTNPTITSGSAGSYALATDGTPTVITLTATDPEEVPLTWSYSVTSGSLGTTATVSQADNVFTITPGTDAANDGGTFQLTFSVTDGTNIVNDVSSFTLNFVTQIENSNYTMALVTANNLSGTIDDASYSNNTINTVGSPELQSFSPYRAGGYSTYFDGTGDYLLTGTSAGMDFGTGDFTIEFWINQSSYNSGDVVADGRAVWNDNGWSIETKNNGIQFYSSGGIVLTTSGTDFSTQTNQWIHVAVVRNSGTVTTYINGTNEGSVSYSTSINTTGANLYIGRRSDGNTSFDFNGYMSDFRIVSSAVYTTDFTPSTERLTAITNTELLTCHLPYIADGSTNDHTITVNGNTASKPFAPYDYDTFDPAVYGGSIYFDGTTAESVWVGNNTILSSLTDFTIDFWYYPLSLTHNTPSYTVLFHSSDAGLYGAGCTEINLTSDGTIVFFVDTQQLSSGTSKVKVNQWNHIAITQSGTTQTMFLNGKVVDSASGSTIDIDQSKVPYIGDRMASAQSANYPSYGYISDMRLHRHGMYTGDFTPPTEVTASTSEPVSSQATRFHLATNTANIVDKSQINTLTLVGNTTASTAQTKYASSSIYFDGASDYIITTQQELGTEDFTIEGWHYLLSRSNNRNGIFGNYSSYSAGSLGMFAGHSSGSSTAYQVSYNGAAFPASVIQGGTIVYNQWVHFAVVRNSGILNLYINGTSVGSISATASLNGVGSNFAIGAPSDNLTDGMQGYLEDFRITKGLARYTANFTPPAASLDG